MKSCRLLLAAALVLAACTPKAKIDCTIKDAPSREVEVRLLEVNSQKVLDTLKTDRSGSFRYSIPVQKGQPQFVYIFCGDNKIASLLLSNGDRVRVTADTLGNYSVTGSEDSQLLQESEKSYTDFAARMAGLDESNASGREIAGAFVDYYRSCVRFVISHPKSLVCVPVLYQKVTEGTPVFNQYTDAILFRQTLDSLKTVYPKSRYVRALEQETVAREKQLELYTRLSGAEPAAYPELTLPGLDGQNVSLAGLGAKVVILHFWDPSDAAQKMFNQDVLKPLYKRWHGRGLEIYSVGVSVDKPAWAKIVKSQELPWVNVCDGQGVYSQALRIYNVGALPWSALISEDGVGAVSGERGLEKELSRLLN